MKDYLLGYSNALDERLGRFSDLFPTPLSKSRIHRPKQALKFHPFRSTSLFGRPLCLFQDRPVSQTDHFESFWPSSSIHDCPVSVVMAVQLNPYGPSTLTWPKFLNFPFGQNLDPWPKFHLKFHVFWAMNSGTQEPINFVEIKFE